jgi:3-oxoacyl-[acyl-carrier protein] reductase
LGQDDGRVALVSAGSHGIGAATVRRLAAHGWDISFSYREDGPAVRQAEKAASELGARVVAIQADVTDPAQVTSWFRAAEDELGPVTAVVSCAGITRDRPLPLMADDDWRAVIDGVFHLCLAAVSALTKQRSGRIVAVTSVCGAYDHSAGGHDILARPGIAGFVKALAGQTARYGVNVNAVVPGLVTHDMADLVPEHARADVTKTIAIRRFGDAAAAADLVAFLLSDAAADITGTVLEAHSAISLSAGHDTAGQRWAVP